MKAILTFLSFVSLSSSQFAMASNIFPVQRHTLYNCSTHYENSRGPIKGAHLEIYQDTTAGKISYGAIAYPICPVCMVMPKYYSFNQSYINGTQLVFAGTEADIVIALESLLPTRTHSATLKVHDEINSSVNYTCTAAE